MSLEKMVQEIEKNMVISDVHIPFEDKDAVLVMQRFAKDYKPNNLYINGDLLDFYSLSNFDKCPERKETVTEEVYRGREFLYDMRKVVGKNCAITLLEGNHEARLQKYFWKNPELYGLDSLDLSNLLELSKFGVSFVRADPDYWGKDTGHVRQGDALIMHGDNRLNGAKGGLHGGYNTMKAMCGSTVIGHTHKLSQRHLQNAYAMMTGVETGCLCQTPGNTDYQQGFVTFSTIGDKNVDYQLHRIKNGELQAGKWLYKATHDDVVRS